jgi:hypothetical protein
VTTCAKRKLFFYFVIMKKFEKLNDSKFAGATLSTTQMNTIIGGSAGGSRCFGGTDCGTYSSDSTSGGSTTYHGWKATSSDSSN